MIAAVSTMNSARRADSPAGTAAVPSMTTSSASRSRRKRPGAKTVAVLASTSVVAPGDGHLHRPARLELRVGRDSVRHGHLRRVPGSPAAREHLGDGFAGDRGTDAQPALDEPLVVT